MTSPPPGGLESLVGDRGPLREILVDHAVRGLRIQVLLRLVLAAFVVAAIAFEPPAYGATVCWLLAGCYAVWAVVGAVLAPRGGLRAVRLAWLALFVDLAALSAITIVASGSDQISWTDDVLVNGFAVVPMISATSLRPRICAAVVAPTVIVYFISSALARDPNGEPWSLIWLRTLVIATLALGAVLLSSVQRSRVEAIAALAADRNRLLEEQLLLEERERTALAEHLHDGALQYVLGARQELSAIRRGDDPAAVDRVDEALRESARLLRSTLTELHPAVLEQAGLPAALADLAIAVGHRTGLRIEVDTAGWPDGARTPVDSLLFATARELLTNVVKHAHAENVDLTIELDEGLARLVVVDDGVGIDDGLRDQRVAQGHIGLASRRVHVESAGGTLTVQARPAGGTAAIAAIPLT